MLHSFIGSRFRSLGFETKILETDTASLHYFMRPVPRPAGTLVLIHGLGTSSSTWVKILPRLGTRFTIVAPDLPGFGRSKVRDACGYCTLRQHAATIVQLLQHLQTGPVILVGQSMGGWICGMIAAGRDVSVERLVLMNTAGVYYRGIEDLRTLFSPTTVPEARTMLNALWYRYPWYFRPFTRSVLRDLDRHHMRELVESVNESDFLVEELTQLTMPVDVVWGMEDRIISQQTVDVLRKLVPRLRVFPIERCGHVPQLECPKQCAEVLRHILGEEGS